MRAAPAVSVDANDGGFGRAAAALLAGLTAAVALRWAWAWLAVPMESLSTLSTLRAGGLAVPLVGALACGAWAWRHAGTGPVRLSWDGASWHWQAGAAAPVPGRARVVFDLGGWLLLAFDPDRPAPAGRPRGGWAAWRRRRGAARRWRVLDPASAQPARAALHAAPPAERAAA